MKKFWLLVSMLTCIFIMAACSTSDSAKKASFDYDKNTLMSTAKEYLEMWNTTDFSEYLTEELKAQVDEKTIAQYTSWEQLKDDLGKFKSTTDKSLVENGDTVKVIFRNEYAKGKMDFTVVFNSQAQAEEVNAQLYKSLAENMKYAGLNTVLGMGIVFSVLIFISFIIGLMKYIPVLLGQTSKEAVTQKAPVTPVDSVIASIVEQEEELSDDMELVAVVTAAIMASLGEDAPADGLVVRSIRKRNTKQWKNA